MRCVWGSNNPSRPLLPEPNIRFLMPFCSSRFSSSVMGAMLVQATFHQPFTPYLQALAPFFPHTCLSRFSSSVMGAMLVQATLASAAAALAAFTCAFSCFTFQ